MIAVYFLISVFTQFSPQNFWLPVNDGPSEVLVDFADVKGVSVGAAVLLDGHLIGKVNSVEGGDEVEDSSNQIMQSSNFTVSLSIAPTYRNLIKQGTIALIKSPLTFKSNAPRSVVELLIPEKKSNELLINGSRIFGFSSYQEFWSADLSDLGLPEGSFEASLG